MEEEASVSGLRRPNNGFQIVFGGFDSKDTAQTNHRVGVLFAQVGCAAASMAGVAPQLIIAALLLPHRNDGRCDGNNFYNYDAFIEAANSFPGFGTTGDTDVRKREIAAFLGQTSQETSGGWATAPDGPYSWGYCFVRERFPGSSYCAPNPNYPCAPGQEYYGRGPIQLSWNYNYGQCGEALELNLLNNPDLVATDPVISFKTALWFWMTPQSPKPSCHDVITGNWNPTSADIAAGRLPGYGTTTNIINGGLECGQGWNERVEGRIGFYKRYCDFLGVGYGDNLDCYNQRTFGNGLLVDTM
nr:endochitinase [Quercus suber]